jgi:hypothetical protein
MQIYNFPDQMNGDTFPSRDVTIKNKTTQLPMNLTNCVIKCEFRMSNKTGTVVQTLTNGSGITIQSAENGIFTIHSFDANWGAGVYYYDFEFNFPGGKKITYFGGYMKLIQDVTQ